jgi:MoxR-like ATPase
MILGAKARALLHGRAAVLPEDVRAVAAPVLRHRIVLNFNAEADGIRPDEIVRRLIGLASEHAPPPAALPPIFRSAGG